MRHLVNSFNSYDASAELTSLDTFFQFALCLTWTKYQDSLCATNTRNYCIIVNVKMSPKHSLQTVICQNLLFIGSRSTYTTRTSGLFFNL